MYFSICFPVEEDGTFIRSLVLAFHCFIQKKNSAIKEFKMDRYGSLYQSRKGLFTILNLLCSLSLDTF